MANVARMGETTQRPNEEIAYSFETPAADWSTPVANLEKEVRLIHDDADTTVTEENATDVTVTVTTGSPSVSGTTVTMAKLGPLTDGQVYRHITRFTDAAGNGPFERYVDIKCVAEIEAP